MIFSLVNLEKKKFTHEPWWQRLVMLGTFSALFDLDPRRMCCPVLELGFFQRWHLGIISPRLTLNVCCSSWVQSLIVTIIALFSALLRDWHFPIVIVIVLFCKSFPNIFFSFRTSFIE